MAKNDALQEIQRRKQNEGKKKRSLSFYVAIILGITLMVVLLVVLVGKISDDNESTNSTDKDNISTDSVSVSDLDPPVLNEVANVATGVYITWEAVSGTDMYRVYYKTDSGGWTEIADVSDTSYVWTGAESGMNYAFTVRCISSDDGSVTSDYDRIGMGITYIAAPQITQIAVNDAGVKKHGRR